MKTWEIDYNSYIYLVKNGQISVNNIFMKSLSIVRMDIAFLPQHIDSDNRVANDDRMHAIRWARKEAVDMEFQDENYLLKMFVSSRTD